VADQLPLAHFDLVICNDVIEHMTDHEWFLRDIKKHMAPGAMLLASIPNVRYHENLFNLIVLRDWHYQDYGILDRTHFRFFTFRSTRRSFEQAGYRLVRFEGINALPVTGWGVYKVAHRMFRGLLLLASLGRGGDVRFLQMGVLATPV
jgi:2-polyprenyl-3-methyl-5-hydroxy-6-metoxy-1,4-benzoquinol methylase